MVAERIEFMCIVDETVYLIKANEAMRNHMEHHISIPFTLPEEKGTYKFSGQLSDGVFSGQFLKIGGWE